MSTPVTFRGSYLIPDPGRATVADVMHSGVVACHPDATLREVAEAIARHGVHAVVVDGIALDAIRGERLVWGVASDRDLVRAFSLDRDRATAAEIASTEPITIAPGDTLAEAARLMEEHEVAHLIVVSADGRPVGMLSTLDLARALAWGGHPTG